MICYAAPCGSESVSCVRESFVEGYALHLLKPHLPIIKVRNSGASRTIVARVRRKHWWPFVFKKSPAVDMVRKVPRGPQPKTAA
jgi:hypothetical protein